MCNNTVRYDANISLPKVDLRMNALQSYSQMKEGGHRNTIEYLFFFFFSAVDSTEIHNLRKLVREDSVYVLGAQTESFIFQQQQNRLDIFK